MKTLVIFHSADFDGLFCREIARKFLPDAELVGWDYGQPPINPDGFDQVYVLDLSPECVEGFVACESLVFPEAQRLIWIDHHKSAIEKFQKGVPGYRIDGVAACRLAWQWFMLHAVWDPREQHPPYTLPEKQDFIDRKVIEPLAVRLAGEYDIWDKRDPDAELFQHGLKSQSLDSLWEILLSGPTAPKDGQEGLAEITVAALLDAGRAIQYAKTQENESIIKAAGFTIEFEGLKFFACNHARYNSFLFTAGLTPDHDACFGFAYRKGEWHVSLYHAPGKEHHDLSQIAVKYGGGGHRGACGFRTITLPFLT